MRVRHGWAASSSRPPTRGPAHNPILCCSGTEPATFWCMEQCPPAITLGWAAWTPNTKGRPGPEQHEPNGLYRQWTVNQGGVRNENTESSQQGVSATPHSRHLLPSHPQPPALTALPSGPHPSLLPRPPRALRNAHEAERRGELHALQEADAT